MDVAAHAQTGMTLVYRPAMTRRTTLALIAVAVMGLAVGSLTAWRVMNRSSDAEPSWLFSQEASGGTLTPEADGTYTLTLTGVTSNADTLTYTATLITDKVPSGLKALADVPNTQPPASFASASLFIDAAALGCSADSCLSPVEQGILKDLGYSDEPPQSAA